MKRYSEKTNDWTKGKALGFFMNFINNHKGSVNDNDTFALVCELIPHSEWLTQIRNSFTSRKLSSLQNAKTRQNRLDFEDEPKEIMRELWSDAPSRKPIRLMFGKIISQYLQKKPVERSSSEGFPLKIAELQKTLGLSNFETDILLVLAFVRNDMLTIEDGHGCRPHERDKVVFISKCLDCDPLAVLESLAEKSKLRRYECVDDDLDFNGQLNGFLNGIITEPLANSYFQRDKTEVLPWSFYGDFAKTHGEILKNMIRASQKTTGVNILLYGAPGTGKTSFAKTLAAELGLACFCIAQSTKDNRGGRSCSTPEFRFGALQICDSQIEPVQSMIVVDEADDMLRSRGGSGLFAFLGGSGSVSTGDKGMLNSVLDTIKTPTIWITNTQGCELDESSRRRFDYSIRFDPLNSTQRLAIWKNNVAKMNLEKIFDDEMLQKFAERYAVSAGGITSVLKNAAKMNPQKEEVAHVVEQLMKPHCELLNIPAADNRFLPAQDYSLDGLNIKGDIRLERITEAIRNYQGDDKKEIDRPRMNLLLSGAPGTGKTEFVKYLGKTLNTKVHIVMGSDLLDMFVGGTEKNIRRAFTQAEAEKAILFLDEIDGLVQSRERAQRSWEVTQVNELLHQMENFNGVMIGATNFAANLDAAILRRFTFKLEFDYLDNAGKTLFFEVSDQSAPCHRCGRSESSSATGVVESLTRMSSSQRRKFTLFLR
ncbi:MAG: ATP-binding protein, partial [Alphaproteobacteria bacterium]|nr:ATP-binding protein [Alphaproteobacteria bacterium]